MNDLSVSRRLFVSVLGAVPLSAAEFWEKKKRAEWNDKEIKKLLTDSPWCRTVSGSFKRDARGGGKGQGGGVGQGGGMNQAGGMGRNGGTMAQGGGMARGGGGGGRGGRGGGGMGGGGSMGGMGGGDLPSTPSFTALLRWASALPVKEALLKAKLGDEIDASAEAKESLGREENSYVIALLGLPPAVARTDPKRMQAGLKSGTTLVRKGKPAIVPQEVTVHRLQNGLSIVYQFPRTDPITLDDKEVEFISRVGPVEFKRKFKLKEMVYGGNLAL